MTRNATKRFEISNRMLNLSSWKKERGWRVESEEPSKKRRRPRTREAPKVFKRQSRWRSEIKAPEVDNRAGNANTKDEKKSLGRRGV
ncbi:hypothetical protein IMZ48_38305 [Candidatus Bathyarchaeota archaeon]|nr:hypothetical protein [Candidatus Bathyarchaeota archaeon]